jgi:hypothetical protein
MINPQTNVSDISAERRDQRLRDEFDLVPAKVPVYFLDRELSKARSESADRVAKHRAKQAATGLKTASVPGDLLEKVKCAGGWNEFVAECKQVQVERVEVVKEVQVEVVKEVFLPSLTSVSDSEKLAVGSCVLSLKGWKKSLVLWLLKS